MKMNIDCIRNILGFIINNQQVSDNLELIPVSCDNIYSSNELKLYTKQDIYYSLLLLSEGGYIKCGEVKFGEIINIYEINRVTYHGHMFYESIREPTVWEKTKTTAKRAGNHTLGFIEKVAHDVAVEGVKAIIAESTK